MNMIRKGQIQRTEKRVIDAQVRLLAQILGIAV